MSLKIERLAWAIAEKEGWMSALERPSTKGSRSYRNHNPGNLRHSPFQIGVIEGYAIFKSDMDGFAALIWDLRQKSIGNTSTGLTPDATLRDLIEVWAPYTDLNDTDKYIADVVQMTGFKETDRLKDICV